MRFELQLSYQFLADYLAAKVTNTIAAELPVGFTLPLGWLSYEPAPSPDISNLGPGVVRVVLQFGVGALNLPALQLDLGATIVMNQLAVTASLSNRDQVVQALQNLAGGQLDPSQIPASIQAPLDLGSLLGAGAPAPTQAGFAADEGNKVVALRVEFGPIDTPIETALWPSFINDHLFVPIFQPADITANPPRHWGAWIDWRLLKPMFAAQVEPLAKQHVEANGPGDMVTGAFLYDWGLQNGQQPPGFADGWPLGNTNTVDLDVTCPVYISGHDGHVYIQASLSSGGPGLLHVHAQLEAHVSCKWANVPPVDLTTPLGDFPFDGNRLEVGDVRTDLIGMILQGDVAFQMPLEFPTPRLDVGAFEWAWEDSCDPSTECQATTIYLDSAAGNTTPLRSRLHVSTSPSFPFTIQPSRPADEQGIYTGWMVWGLVVAKGDIPPGGGEVIISVETNAGTPQLGAGESLAIPLAPPLTAAEEKAREVDRAIICFNARALNRRRWYRPPPPEESIWWVTQEVLIMPAASATTPPTVVLGASSRTAVAKSALPAALRLQKDNPHGIIQSQSIGAMGLRIVYTTAQRGQ
jgi:hypothetical protein